MCMLMGFQTEVFKVDRHLFIWFQIEINSDDSYTVMQLKNKSLEILLNAVKKGTSSAKKSNLSNVYF